MDKVSERVYQQMCSTIPEEILGKMTVSVSATGHVIMVEIVK